MIAWKEERKEKEKAFKEQNTVARETRRGRGESRCTEEKECELAKRNRPRGKMITVKEGREEQREDI